MARRRFPPERADRRPEPPRDRARHPAPRSHPPLPPARARPSPAHAARASRSSSCSSSSSRRSPGAGSSAWVAARSSSRSLSATPPTSGVPRPSRCGRRARRSGDPRAPRLLPDGAPCANEHELCRRVSALRGLRLRPRRALNGPGLGLGLEQFRGVLRVRHRPARLRSALVLRRDARRDGVSARRSSPCSSFGSSGDSERHGDSGRALATAGDPLAARARPLAWGMTAALVATLVANLFYLTMTFYYFYVFAALAVALPVVFGRAVRASLKDSRSHDVVSARADDVAGVFVRDAVEHLRNAGLEIVVVSPASFPHFGVAYGDGIVGNLRRKRMARARAPALPPLFCRAARRAARGVDLVHAHWLPSALPALATRKPFVVQLWGTDVELARRAPWSFRWLLRRARVVLCPSTALAAAARELGARDVLSSRAASTSRGTSPRPRSRRTSSTSAGSPRRRESSSCSRRPRVSRASSSVTGHSETASPRQSGSSSRACSASTTSARRSSHVRLIARDTAWSLAKRWRTAARSSPQPSEGSGCGRGRNHGSARSPAGSAGAPDGPRAAARGSGAARASGSRRREKAERDCSWEAATRATIAAYRDAQ